MFDLAWDGTESLYFMSELLLALFLVVVVRFMEQRKGLPRFLLVITKHPIIENDFMRMLIVFSLIFAIRVIFVSPYSLYKTNHTRITELQNTLDDKSPKLDGF